MAERFRNLGRTIRELNANLPGRIEDYLQRGQPEIVRFGTGLTFASGPFAERMDPAALLENVLDQNPDARKNEDGLTFVKKLVERTIKIAGIPVRYFSPPVSAERPLETVFKEAESIGALLTSRIMGVTHHVPEFISSASATLPDTLAQGIANKFGLEIPTFDDRAACASAVIGLIRALTNPDLKNKFGIIAAIEPLGYKLHPRHFKDQLAVAAIFGDYHVAMGIDTSEFEVITHQIKIIPDNGTIRLELDYPVEPYDAAVVPPYMNVTYKNDGERITSATDRGIKLWVERPEPGLTAQMNNELTAGHFIAETPPVIAEELEKFFIRCPGESIAAIIMHDPSEYVSTRIIRRIKDELRKRGIVSEEFIESLPLPQFLLSEMEVSNSSSATTPNKWRYLAQHGRIQPEGNYMIVAPGIGSAIASIIFKYKPKAA